MSLNLRFIDKKGSVVPFPFQTTTRIAKAVMATNDKAERLSAIAFGLRDIRVDEDEIRRLVIQCDALFNKKNLTLEIF